MEKRFNPIGEELARLFFSPSQKEILIIGYDETEPHPDWFWIITDSKSNIEKFLESKVFEQVFNHTIETIDSFENIYLRFRDGDSFRNPFRFSKGMDRPIYHEELVEIYNSKTVVSNHLFEFDRQSPDSIHSEFTLNSINKVAVMLSTALNLDGGSVGNIDLYQLLQAYILDPEKRAKINLISRGF